MSKPRDTQSDRWRVLIGTTAEGWRANLPGKSMTDGYCTYRTLANETVMTYGAFPTKEAEHIAEKLREGESSSAICGQMGWWKEQVRLGGRTRCAHYCSPSWTCPLGQVTSPLWVSVFPSVKWGSCMSSTWRAGTAQQECSLGRKRNRLVKKIELFYLNIYSERKVPMAY